jgi:transposase
VTDRTYTTEQAARRLGVPANVIAKWKHRGRIMPADYVQGRGHKAPLYLLEELVPLANAWQRRAATRRNKG